MGPHVVKTNKGLPIICRVVKRLVSRDVREKQLKSDETDRLRRPELVKHSGMVTVLDDSVPSLRRRK